MNGLMDLTTRLPSLFKVVLFLYFQSLLMAQTSTENGDGMNLKDYCQWEDFTAVCEPGEVIMMQHAKYGRMEYGRCVDRDYGYVGCSTDVLLMADARCSGRQDCSIKIPDEKFDLTRPCPKDLIRYLAAEFTCVKVISATRQDCMGPGFVKLKPEQGYISSLTTEETGCGTTEAPWVIQGKPGQHINITMYDFGLVVGNNTKPDTKAMEHCHVYVIIKERNPSRSLTVCGGRDRISNIYSSKGSTVEIRVVIGSSPSRARYFMLQYDTIGCPDIDPGNGGWVEREGDKILVGCKDVDTKWQATCNGTHWIGDIGKCTTTRIASKMKIGGISLSYGMSIALIISIAVGIGLCMLVVGIVCLRKKRNSQRNQSQQPVQDMGFNTWTKEGQYNKVIPPGDMMSRQDTPSENEYAYVEDLIRPTTSPRYDHAVPVCGADERDLQPHNYAVGGQFYAMQCPPGQGRNCTYYTIGTHNAPHYFELDPDGRARVTVPCSSMGPKNTLTDFQPCHPGMSNPGKVCSIKCFDDKNCSVDIKPDQSPWNDKFHKNDPTGKFSQ